MLAGVISLAMATAGVMTNMIVPSAPARPEVVERLIGRWSTSPPDLQFRIRPLMPGWVRVTTKPADAKSFSANAFVTTFGEETLVNIDPCEILSGTPMACPAGEVPCYYPFVVQFLPSGDLGFAGLDIDKTAAENPWLPKPPDKGCYRGVVGLSPADQARLRLFWLVDPAAEGHLHRIGPAPR